MNTWRRQLVEDLKAIRELLSDPAHWTQGTHARDADGNRVDSMSKYATCFCLDGAAQRVTEQRNSYDEYAPRLEAIHDAFNSCIPENMTCDFVTWQDREGRQHAEVIQLIDAAIAQEETPCSTIDE